MASIAPLQSFYTITKTRKHLAVASSPSLTGFSALPTPTGRVLKNKKRSLTVVAAVGDVSADGTTYLFIGAATVALLGTAFPVLFSRKDTCPECDGAGFVRKSGVTLRANAARKDETQIVCARCSGLGKLNQIDK
ncbi:uncharacterized protein LOC116135297 [Pistacia vera]|uniref:Uncharacterized protein n=1 Tax=Pistacia atlantica TaxID=434234 RepID=A0ACC1AQI4_9ROSI|nr:uncharacterized protein LOC116135297 [Pistacia vera]KAJ0088845.1 hypothetical protein Patl1_31839 [Pistacia atlantica]